MEKREFGQLRQTVKDLKQETNILRDVETQSLENKWGYYDSDAIDFEKDFREVFGSGIETFEKYLEEYYSTRKGDLIGIEIGGPGINLFNDLNQEGFFKKTVGVTLAQPKNTDKLRKPHEVIFADVFNKRSRNDNLPGYQKLMEWVEKNGKADLLIERMAGGIPPLDQEMFLQIIKRWYKLLNEEGTMFIQNPILETRDDLGFMMRLSKCFRNQFNLAFDYASQIRTGNSFSVIRLKKLPGAPDSLDGLLKYETK